MSLKASLLAAALLAAAALQPAQAATRSVAAVEGLALRAKPDAGAKLIRRLPVLTEVIILGKAKPATIAGRNDKWVYVQANYCPDSADRSLLCETVYQKGWVADSGLAYGGRFEPLDAWREGRIEVKSGNTSWTYSLATDGGYTLDWESWSYDTELSPCPAERKKGRYCVETRAETGRLHRYRNVVRPGTGKELLYVDADGALCDRLTTPETRYCDR